MGLADSTYPHPVVGTILTRSEPGKGKFVGIHHGEEVRHGQIVEDEKGDRWRVRIVDLCDVFEDVEVEL